MADVQTYLDKECTPARDGSARPVGERALQQPRPLARHSGAAARETAAPPPAGATRARSREIDSAPAAPRHTLGELTARPPRLSLCYGL